MAEEFLESHRAILRQRAAASEELALPPKLPEKYDPARAATLVDFCHMLMNANEFVFIN